MDVILVWLGHDHDVTWSRIPRQQIPSCRDTRIKYVNVIEHTSSHPGVGSWHSPAHGTGIRNWHGKTVGDLMCPAPTIVFARNGPQGWPHHNMPPFLTRSVSRILRTKPRTEQKSSCCRCMKSIHCLDLWNNLKNIFQGEWLDILVVNSWGLNDLHPRFPELASTSKYLLILLYNWWSRKQPTLR